jgi:hypothetical protein
MKQWLRGWLGITDLTSVVFNISSHSAEQARRITANQDTIGILQNEIRELRAEVTRLQVAQYVPPQTPEPEHKIIKTQTFKQYQAAMEKEFEEREASSAI